MQAVEDWTAKENEYRLLLKNEDRKHMEERDYVQLNVRQERNRVFTKVFALFPAGIIDLPALRGLNRAAKLKASRKTAAKEKNANAAAKPAKSPSGVKRKASPTGSSSGSVAGGSSSTKASTPKTFASKSVTPKASAAGSAATGSASSPPTAPSGKRNSRPPKTRVIDECPPFNEQDFVEIAAN